MPNNRQINLNRALRARIGENLMKQKYLIGLGVILAISLATQVPFGLMKQEETNNPLALIYGALQSIDAKLDTIIILLTPPEPPTGPGYNAPTVESVIFTPAYPEDGDAVWLEITVYDEDVGQALDISTKFVQMPPFSSAVLTPSIGYTPAFIADRAGWYVLRVTVTDETGRSGWMDVDIVVAETQP